MSVNPPSTMTPFPARPKTAGVRPCYDCPFRSDIPGYSTVEDVRRNSEELRSITGIAACHHSIFISPQRGNRHSDKKQVACVGFLTVVSNTFPANYNCWLATHEFNPEHGIPCYRSLAEYRAGATCSDQSDDGRLAAWLISQPAHKRERVIADIQARKQLGGDA